MILDRAVKSYFLFWHCQSAELNVSHILPTFSNEFCYLLSSEVSSVHHNICRKRFSIVHVLDLMIEY